MKKEYTVRQITHGPKHHLFGFHDLVQTNAKGDLALALEVDDISHPPLPGDVCAAGVIDLKTGEFKKLHDTYTWNYPQGARQQWIGDTDLCVCNDRAEDGTLISHLSDARQGKVIKTLPFPIHCVGPSKQQAFYMNYDRTYACGGYGYCGSSHKGKWEDLPKDDGIFVGSIETGQHKLLASIYDVALCGEARPVRIGLPHYVTHFMLNPSGTRLAFLHRYLVPDGGGITRLMTIGVDGSDMRCLAKGFLSHFTWISDEELFIWGKNEPALCKMREAAWLRVPGILQLALFAKKCMRGIGALKNLRKNTRSTRHPSSSPAPKAQDKAFLIIKDSDNPTIVKNGLGILTEDGHPMARPGRLTEMINDTYPDEHGVRTLMLYNSATSTRENIGTFRMIFDKPDTNRFNSEVVLKGRDPRVNKKTNREGMMFAFSGFHCDLHPRWSFDGKMALFDSIHDGSRQIYSVGGI